jgi:hypothetical protein
VVVIRESIGNKHMATHSSLPGDPGGVTLETITPDFGQAALEWFNFGLSVIPLLPGKKVTAVKWDRWLEPLSPDSIGAYWAEHPDHEVGCIVGDGLIVLDADTPVAGAALAKIEDAFDVVISVVAQPAGSRPNAIKLSPSGSACSWDGTVLASST